MKEQWKNLRETEVPCDAEPNGPPGGIWSVSCSTTKSEILARALTDASTGKAVGGEIYRGWGQDNVEFMKLGTSVNDWKAVGSVDCVGDESFEIQYFGPEEAMPWGTATGVDVSKGFMALYPPDQ